MLFELPHPLLRMKQHPHPQYKRYVGRRHAILDVVSLRLIFTEYLITLKHARCSN